MVFKPEWAIFCNGCSKIKNLFCTHKFIVIFNSIDSVIQCVSDSFSNTICFCLMLSSFSDYFNSILGSFQFQVLLGSFSIQFETVIQILDFSILSIAIADWLWNLTIFARKCKILASLQRSLRREILSDQSSWRTDEKALKVRSRHKKLWASKSLLFSIRIEKDFSGLMLRLNKCPRKILWYRVPYCCYRVFQQ